MLVTQLKESQVDSEKFQKKLQASEKREENANKALAKVNAKLDELVAKKRKAAAKKAAAKRKTSKKKPKKATKKKSKGKKSKKKSRR